MNENNDIREPLNQCSTIESLTITGPPETTGVTSFVQEACTAVSAVDVKFSSTDVPLQLDMQDVRKYFSRPVCFASGSIPSSVRSTFNSGIPAFSDIIAYWTTGQQRLLGAFGIRATVVYTLQVSATPFHQGIVALAFQYGYQAGTPHYSRATDPCTVTNLPHVVLDFSVSSMVQLKLPFLHVGEYCDIRGTSAFETKYGQWSLATLAEVPTVVGMGVPTYQLYCHLEDIELFGVTPQATSLVVLNAGRKMSPVAEEFEQDTHPYSSALHASGRALSFIAKGVPSLSSLAGPTSWALGKAASLARFFGYGKPAVTDPLMRIVRQTTVGEFNTDVATSSMVLAATATNTTSIHTGVAASDVDEMSLKYITSRWSQIRVFNFSTGNTAGTLLYAVPISPLSWWFRAGGGLTATNKHMPAFSTATSNSIQPSHLMFAASSFKQWTGSVKFRFTFVKTKMHAGRVMAVFNPQVLNQTFTNYFTTSTNAVLPAYGASGPDPFAYSAIFDLKDSNVFEFEVPFVSPIPYINISGTAGFLGLYLVNPLIASSVVSNIISVIVEVAGGSDFQLSNPATIISPVHNTGTIALQSGRVYSETFDAVNQKTMGETITSVKQLISIPHVTILTGSGAQNEAVPPWYYMPSLSAATPAPSAQPPAMSFGHGGNWASCYSFLKGGTDLHVYDAGKTSTISVYQIPLNGGTNAPVTTPENRSTMNAPYMISTENVLHTRLPGFFPTVRVNTWIANALTAAGVSWTGTNPAAGSTNVSPYNGIQALYYLKTAPNSAGSGGVLLFVSTNASDDAQLGMYIGPPPMFLPPSNALSDPYDVDSRFSGAP